METVLSSSGDEALEISESFTGIAALCGMGMCCNDKETEKNNVILHQILS